MIRPLLRFPLSTIRAPSCTCAHKSKSSYYFLTSCCIVASQVQVPARCAVQGSNEIAEARSRYVVGVLMRALLVVPVPVPVVLLAPLVCDSTNRAKNTSLPIYGSAKKYTSDTNERTNHELNNNYNNKFGCPRHARFRCSSFGVEHGAPHPSVRGLEVPVDESP